MTRLTWDEVDERRYETGIDHGVLYIPSSPGVYDNGVVWNGMTAVRENFEADQTQSNYFDGLKYLDSYNIGDYSAVLEAFTYPDEFSEFEGLGVLGEGLYVDDQVTKMFGLSYRTRTDNNGYQIHLLYNLTATPPDLTYETKGETLSALVFSWIIDSVPETVLDYRPTAHVILDSRLLVAELFEALEDIIYGSADTNPSLPNINDLIQIALYWGPKLIIPQEVTGLSELVDGYGDLNSINIPGIFATLPPTRLTETSVDGLYQLTV